jgi:hypothetical protein
MNLYNMSVAIPLYADDDRIKEDIAEVGTTNAVILQKIKRANEDASMEMGALFENNFDPNNLDDWFVSITTEYATSLFWKKSTGTAQAVEQAKDVYTKAKRILIQRFQPVGSRVT